MSASPGSSPRGDGIVPSRGEDGSDGPGNGNPGNGNPGDRLASLLSAARGRPERLGAAGIFSLGREYRAAAAELARRSKSRPSSPATAELAERVVAAHGLVYSSERRTLSVVDAVTTGYWRAVYSNRAMLAVAAAFTFLPAVAGLLWALSDPAAAAGLVPGAFQGVTQIRPHGANLGLPLGLRAVFASGIFTHNITISFLAFAGGVTGGLVTAAALAYNGLVIGVFAGLAVDSGSGGTFTRLVAPHGMLELSCIVVAGAAGLSFGRALVDPGVRSRTTVLAEATPPLVTVVVGTAGWLVVAGLTEGFVTPTGLSLPAALGVGAALAATFWSLVVWRGRAPKPSPSS